jgi:uncharacterized Zn finger protein (UPF0148 family)
MEVVSMSDKCESCGVPFADHDGLVPTCRKLKDAEAEVVRLREALEYIAYHGIDMPSNREISEADWWHRIAFDCMGHAKEALEAKEQAQ